MRMDKLNNHPDRDGPISPSQVTGVTHKTKTRETLPSYFCAQAPLRPPGWAGATPAFWPAGAVSGDALGVLHHRVRRYRRPSGPEARPSGRRALWRV